MIQTIDQRLRQWLRQLPRERIRMALLGLLGLALAIQLINLVYAIITPTGTFGDWRVRAPSAPSAATRADLYARIDPFYRSQSAPGGAGSGAVTSLKLTLFGIRVNEATNAGSAIIAGADGVQASVGVGEEIQPGVKLAAVAFDHVEIDNNGKRELLYLDQSDATGTPPPAPGIAPAAPSAPRAEATISPVAPISPLSLRAGISFQPRTEGTRITGIAVGEQGDGSAFQAAGFRPGDVIRQVNGQPIGSAGDVSTLLNNLRPGARLTMQVERGRETVNLSIIIPNSTP